LVFCSTNLSSQLKDSVIKTHNLNSKKNEVKLLQVRINYLSDSIRVLTKSINKLESNEKSIFRYIEPLVISCIVSLVIVFLFFLIFKKLWSREKILDNVKTSIKNNNGRLKDTILDLINEHQTFSKAKVINFDIEYIVRQVLINLKKDINYQELLVKQLEINKVNSKTAAPNLQNIQNSIAPIKSKYFFSIEPRSGGNFFLVEKTTLEFVETESVYKFEIINENLANFYVVDDVSTMKRAINFKSDLLNVACDSYSSSNSAQKINTEQCGVVKRQEDKWVIEKKAKIKFI